MSQAAQRPTFDPGGAPVSLLVDFDGTISAVDVPDALLAKLVDDQALVQHMDRLYVEGRMGSRELAAWDMEVLPRDPELLLREVACIADEGKVGVEQRGIKVQVRISTKRCVARNNRTEHHQWHVVVVMPDTAAKGTGAGRMVISNGTPGD